MKFPDLDSCLLSYELSLWIAVMLISNAFFRELALERTVEFILIKHSPRGNKRRDRGE